jgi:hypothetical protein
MRTPCINWTKAVKDHYSSSRARVLCHATRARLCVNAPHNTPSGHTSHTRTHTHARARAHTHAHPRTAAHVLRRTSCRQVVPLLQGKNAARSVRANRHAAATQSTCVRARTHAPLGHCKGIERLVIRRGRVAPARQRALGGVPGAATVGHRDGRCVGECDCPRNK